MSSIFLFCFDEIKLMNCLLQKYNFLNLRKKIIKLHNKFGITKHRTFFLALNFTHFLCFSFKVKCRKITLLIIYTFYMFHINRRVYVILLPFYWIEFICLAKWSVLSIVLQFIIEMVFTQRIFHFLFWCWADKIFTVNLMTMS